MSNASPDGRHAGLVSWPNPKEEREMAAVEKVNAT